MTAAVRALQPDFAAAAAVLRSSADYRVLQRFVPRERYGDEPWNLGDPVNVRIGAFLDCETTGLDRDDDQVIEFGLVPFTYNSKTGDVYDVRISDAICAFEEPHLPISEEVTALTGITPAMVKGHRLPDDEILERAQNAGILIAHNAEFDRPVLERRIPAFKQLHWGCSQKEVPWQQFGVVGAKLQHILADTCREFYDAHRALDDCLVGIHCLAAAQCEGRTALSYLLESARKPTVRVWALDSPFPKKEKLKIRRPKYLWSDGSEFSHKGWYVDVKPESVDAEIEWLLVEIYSGRQRQEDVIRTESYNSLLRYSRRIGR